MANYTTKTNIEQRLDKTLSTAQSTFVTSVLLPAIDKYIENYTLRVFNKQDSSALDYTGSGKRTLDIKDYQSIASVEAFDIDDVSQGVIPLADLKFLPIGANYISQLYYKNGEFESCYYKVTGRLGYSENPPSDITLVATELAVAYLQLKGGVYSESIEGYSYTISVTLADVVKSNPVVRDTLDFYKKVLI